MDILKTIEQEIEKTCYKVRTGFSCELNGVRHCAGSVLQMTGAEATARAHQIEVAAPPASAESVPAAVESTVVEPAPSK